MGERDRSPPFVFGREIHIQFDLLVALFNFVRHGQYVLEVLPEYSALVGFLDSQNVGPDSVDIGFLDGPGNLGAEKSVLDGVVVVVLEEYVVGFVTGKQVGEVGVFNGGEGVEVDGDFPVELVLLEVLVELWDFVELVNVTLVD